mmetsp:Transcript_75219/g.243499  ORF Transcript_75219/g.243499 Transcript_75219/m.243499 type:complete len:353 (+) Transcript_75219:177-1235(+)|eukprot:CAMPEP_0203877834 /NCGR_PEP_ID=MMETSP0359-20131031/22404_1 /ASSEMBLY_ACC=CAM_ASM_000338 /TAXON_ID=268821 /ORGANISM="Scrippsiella Hangoei, Strain SHTV-5" /LENGTH=352 /DNA_ID=CAMNT_0050796885 /DNA_START=161 /DNA_END=1219 /DNA_ORIENTATION=+
MQAAADKAVAECPSQSTSKGLSECGVLQGYGQCDTATGRCACTMGWTGGSCSDITCCPLWGIIIGCLLILVGIAALVYYRHRRKSMDGAEEHAPKRVVPMDAPAREAKLRNSAWAKVTSEPVIPLVEPAGRAAANLPQQHPSGGGGGGGSGSGGGGRGGSGSGGGRGGGESGGGAAWSDPSPPSPTSPGIPVTDESRKTRRGEEATPEAAFTSASSVRKPAVGGGGAIAGANPKKRFTVDGGQLPRNMAGRKSVQQPQRSTRRGGGAEGASAAAAAEQQRRFSSPGMPEATLSPKAAAVRGRMQDLKQEPLAVRKQTFRELVLEYHPDKNSSPDATEVFQMVNGARNWFLQE